jgi:hypothetical protein
MAAGTSLKPVIVGLLFEIHARKPRSYAGTPSLVRLMKQWDDEDYLNGILPVAIIYNRALLATEILNNYNSIKGRFV